MFRFASIAIIFHGFQTEFAGSYFIWFVLSIPFMPIVKDALMPIDNDHVLSIEDDTHVMENE